MRATSSRSGTERRVATTRSSPPAPAGPARPPTPFETPRSSSRWSPTGGRWRRSCSDRTEPPRPSPPDATLIDMSTVGPTSIASVAERLAPVPMLDAPVLGSVPSVESGTLVIFVGGDRDVFDRHADLLSLLGTPRYLGRSGSGAMLKLVNNAAGTAALVAVGELLALTDRAAIDPDVALDSLAAGPLASLIERWRPRLKGEDHASYFRLALARKDLALAIRRGRTERHRAHRRRGSCRPVRRGDRGGARRRGLRRGRPVPSPRRAANRRTQAVRLPSSA